MPFIVPIDEIVNDYESTSSVLNFVSLQNKTEISSENYFDLIDPYNSVTCKMNANSYREVYFRYLFCRTDEYSSRPETMEYVRNNLMNKFGYQTIFWGRVYYKSLGYSTIECESMVANDLRV